VSLGEFSKPPSPQRANLMIKLKETRTSLMQKEEDIRQMIERLQRLEDTQEKQNWERRWVPTRPTRYNMHYGSQEEDEEEWRVQNFEARCHRHHQLKQSMPFVNLPSFNGDSDPNVYLGWEAKVEKTFSAYDVDESQRVKLVSLEFEDYVM